MRTSKKVLFSLLTSATLISHSAFADDLVKPAPVNQSGQFMPGFGNEAIVKARYTVTREGKTDDVQILTYLSNQFLNMSLQGTVACWTFEPATVNGEAVDLYNQEWMFAVRVAPIDPDAPPPAPGGFGGGGFGGGFGGGAPACPDTSAMAAAPAFDPAGMPPIPLQISAEIRESVDEISRIVADKKYDKALREVKKLMRKDLHTVFDYSLANELKASILAAKQQNFEALEASKLATLHAPTPQGGEGYFMDDNMLHSALHKRFLLAAQVRQYPLAWTTYQELIAKFDIPDNDPLHNQAAQIKAVIDAPEALVSMVKIVNKQWSYRPVRRIFTVTDVDGKLKQINARCERTNLELKYQEGVDWTLPASYGECELDFVGSDNTQFALYEFSE